MPIASVDLSSEVWAHQQEGSLPSNILGCDSALSGKTGVSRRQLYRGVFDRSSESDVDSGTNLARVAVFRPHIVGGTSFLCVCWLDGGLD